MGRPRNAWRNRPASKVQISKLLRIARHLHCASVLRAAAVSVRRDREGAVRAWDAPASRKRRVSFGAARPPHARPRRGRLLKTSVCSRAAPPAANGARATRKARVLTQPRVVWAGARHARAAAAQRTSSPSARDQATACNSTCGGRAVSAGGRALRRQCRRWAVLAGIIRPARSASAGNRSSRGSGATIRPSDSGGWRWRCACGFARSVTRDSPLDRG